MEKRTVQQNKALHLYFEHLAQELNDAGFDMRAVLKPEIDIPWSKDTTKLYLWHPIQKILLPDTVVNGEVTTTELDRSQLDKVYNVINRHIGEKLGLHVPFPSHPIYEEKEM